MKTMTIREAREGLSHPDQMFADSDEVLVVCRGEPVARILSGGTRAQAFRSLRAFLESQPMQDRSQRRRYCGRSRGSRA